MRDSNQMRDSSQVRDPYQGTPSGVPS